MHSIFFRTYFLKQFVQLGLLLSLSILNPVALRAVEEVEAEEQKKREVPAGLLALTKNAIALNKQKTLFLDTKEKCLYLQGTVVLNRGLLEMLCCKEQSKEHESIISVNCKAYPIHTGLLALQAKTGKHVIFDPEYKAPTGEKLNITAVYKNKQGKIVSCDAHKWVRTVTRRYFVTPLEVIPEELTIPEDCDLKYDHRRKELLHFSTLSSDELAHLKKLSADKKYHKALETIHKQSQPRLLQADWVFTGSKFQKDDDTGEQRYLAEMGDLICVANFQTAMIDIAIKSSASDAVRGYEANSELVPEPGTHVLLKLQRAVDSKQAKQESGKE